MEWELFLLVTYTSAKIFFHFQVDLVSDAEGLDIVKVYYKHAPWVYLYIQIPTQGSKHRHVCIHKCEVFVKRLYLVIFATAMVIKACS